MTYNYSKKELEELVLNLQLRDSNAKYVCAFEHRQTKKVYYIRCYKSSSGQHVMEALGPHPKRTGIGPYQLGERVLKALLLAAFPQWSPPAGWTP